MNIEVLRYVLLWCSIINYAILILWFLLFMSGHQWMRRKANWYRVSPEQFDMVNLAGLTGYKLAIILFNIVPCIVLHFLA